MDDSGAFFRHAGTGPVLLSWQNRVQSRPALRRSCTSIVRLSSYKHRLFSVYCLFSDTHRLLLFPEQSTTTALSLKTTMTGDLAKVAEEGRLSGLYPSGSEESRASTKEAKMNPFLVTWSGNDDPENPKNWTKRQKWAATFVSLPTQPCFGRR